jgi:hypothetical protein
MLVRFVRRGSPGRSQTSTMRRRGDGSGCSRGRGEWSSRWVGTSSVQNASCTPSEGGVGSGGRSVALCLAGGMRSCGTEMETISLLKSSNSFGGTASPLRWSNLSASSIASSAERCPFSTLSNSRRRSPGSPSSRLVGPTSRGELAASRITVVFTCLITSRASREISRTPVARLPNCAIPTDSAPKVAKTFVRVRIEPSSTRT